MKARQEEYDCTGSYSTIYRVMKAHGLLQKKKHNPNSLTKKDCEAQKSEDLRNQDFTADAPNEKWLTDITEIPTADGKLYIAPVLDCFDGAIVGLAMALRYAPHLDDNMRKELCIASFE